MILGRSTEADPTPVDQWVIDYLGELSLDRLAQILDEAIGRQKMSILLEETQQVPPDPAEGP